MLECLNIFFLPFQAKLLWVLGFLRTEPKLGSWEREPKKGSQERGTLFQIAENKNLARVPRPWEPIVTSFKMEEKIYLTVIGRVRVQQVQVQILVT